MYFASIHACITSLRIFYLCFKDGWTTNDVIYTWKLPDPVQFVSNLFLPGGFELDGYISDNCDITTNTGLYFTEMPSGVSQMNYVRHINIILSGRYSCLTVDMTFKRQLSYYILTIYIPTLMIVLVSWMSFWLDHKSVSIML